MDFKLNEKMIIHDFEFLKHKISIMSGYVFDIYKTIEFIKEEENTIVYFDRQMNITDKGNRGATRVCIDTGYFSKETNDSILLILERAEGPFEGSEVETEEEFVKNIIDTPDKWLRYTRGKILYPSHKVDMFRRLRGIQKERRRYSIDHSLDEVADIPALKEELNNLEFEQYIQLCIENSKKPHTCIKNVSVQNFKSLRDIDNLKMKPITILCGTNSCGKSSFLDSILVLKQTINNLNSNNNLALNGEYVRLGNYTNVVFKQDMDTNISFRLSYESQHGKGIESLIEFISDDDEELEEDKRGSIELEVTFGNSSTKDNKLAAQPNVVYLKAVFDHSKGKSYVELSSVNNELYMLSFNILKPFRTEEIKKKKIKDRWKKTMVEVRNVTFKGFLIEPSSLYDQLQRKSRYSGNTNTLSEKTITENSIVYQFIMAMNTSIINMFDTIHYIGPLREAPSRRYVYDEVISDIGVKGENAAFLFQTEKDVLKNELFVFDDSFDSFQPLETSTLYEAVDYWMKYMGIHSFNTSTNQEIIRVSLSDSNTNSISVNIADVGFGISQVFPIVLEGIRMDKGDTLILEQPEIHLHPKLQMQMADYLLAMAISGRNFVIETHSDHIINRFIRRMVEDEQLQLTDLVQIYFVTPTENGANFEPIMIDDTKGLINWPEGFFDQAADEQEMIIRAGLKKRKKKRQLIKDNKL